MAVGVKINEELLDLNPETNIVTTESVFELGQISDSKGGYSNQFDIPRTSKNIRLLGYITISNLDTNAVNPNKNIPCDILDNDLIVRSGVLEIEKVSDEKNTISLTFFDNNTSFYDVIKNKSIRDLDLSDLDHAYTEANIQDSWSNTTGYVYYPINHNGQWNSKSVNTIDAEDLFPSVFHGTILERIFNQAGRTVEGSLLKDPLFNKNTVAFSQENFDHDENWVAQREIFVTNTTEQEFNPTAVSDVFTIQFNNDTQSPAKDPGGNFNTPTLTIDKDQTGRVVVNLRGSYTMPGGDTATIQFWIYVNGVQQTLIKTVAFTSSTTFAAAIDTTYIASAGDEYEIRAFVSAISTSGTHTLTINEDNTAQDVINKRCRWFTEVDVDITLGAEVQLSRTLPDISQSDFLNEVFFRHQVVMQIEPKSKKARLNMFKDIKKNIGKNYKDWTDKLDLSKDFSVDFKELVSDYGKISKVIHQVDEASVPVIAYNRKLEIPYGDGQILIDNDFISEEEDIFESEVYAVANANSFVYNGEYIDTPTFSRDNGLRFLIYLGQQSIDSLSFGTKTDMDIAGSTETEMPYAYFDKRTFGDENIDSFVQTLNFESRTLNILQGSGMLENYFPDVINILNSPRLFRAFFNLNNLDLHNFDFIVPVFLDIGGETGYFYINKMPENNLGSNDSREVELVKLV